MFSRHVSTVWVSQSQAVTQAGSYAHILTTNIWKYIQLICIRLASSMILTPDH